MAAMTNTAAPAIAVVALVRRNPERVLGPLLRAALEISA
jgi:hypothetical protein